MARSPRLWFHLSAPLQEECQYLAFVEGAYDHPGEVDDISTTSSDFRFTFHVFYFPALVFSHYTSNVMILVLCADRQLKAFMIVVVGQAVVSSCICAFYL